MNYKAKITKLMLVLLVRASGHLRSPNLELILEFFILQTVESCLQYDAINNYSSMAPNPGCLLGSFHSKG